MRNCRKSSRCNRNTGLQSANHSTCQEDVNMQVYLFIYEPAAPLDKMIKTDKVQLRH